MFSRSIILICLFAFLLTDFIAGSRWNLEEERSYPTPVKDSPQLPDLLESLSVQKHCPDAIHDIYAEYDYIVVGAGAAGSVVASRLSEVPCVSVLLLEAGPPPPKLSEVPTFGTSFLKTKLDWKYETTPQNHTGSGQINKKILLPSAKCIGGSTIHNAGIHVRGNKKDYDDWARMGAEGWSYEEVLPYFIKLEDNKDSEYVKNGYHGVGGPITVDKPSAFWKIKEPIFQAINGMGYPIVDPNSRRQTGFYDLQINVRNGQRCSAAKAYLVPVENRTNLDILPNAFVRKVIIKNRKAVGVRFDYNGRTYKVNATREVILSAGAINTPQILMLSGIGPAKHLRQFNIPVRANLPVGMNFQDHGAISTEAVLKSDIQDYADKLSDEAYIKEYIFNRTGPLASAEGLAYVAFLHNDERNPETDFPNYEMYIEQSTTKGNQMAFNLQPEVYKQVYGPYRNASIIKCSAQQLHPYSRGRIKLRSANPYDHPIIDPNYLAHPTDVEVLVAGLKTCKRIFNRPEMKQIIVERFKTLYPGCEDFWNNEDKYLRCVVRTVLYTTSHYCCTAKMGKIGDSSTVLDNQLRVKYIKGLRVADTSAMPKITSGNTGVPAIMIGEKAADMIKKTIQCEDYYNEHGKYNNHRQQNTTESKPVSESKTFGRDESFAQSQSFAGTKSFAPGQSFAGSKYFAPTQSFAGNKYFAPSQSLAGSKYFAPSQPFVGSKSFAPSQSFAESKSFARSQPFAGSKSIASSQSFSGSKSFAPGQPFAGSKSFAPSRSFAESKSFAPSQSYAESKSFAPSQPFVGSKSFAPSQSFSESKSFAPSQSFSESKSFAPSQSFGGSKSIAPSQSFAGSKSYARSAK